ncbi:MAG: bifunctional phosphopantothenoylcysteine decarboxylase/phosphopantothenate--cysteine ligase CoaBC [Bacteroidales bacterium]|nr:bifunctional phosphopantothenoylcysteine decarboxylase/phosphopantothenate--cysteine ligase CoaBC [Bacteroidales bacterium]MCF8403332.1 bifunctional phosphopantothenoylcysteine decarboxylase/phosphopantothenate--cysteine ligase CoaBC [Bacteroidales bacterium]
MLKGKNILIGVTGSIAAYKIPLLVRLLVKEGANVKVILTDSARNFVTPLTLSTLTGNPVYSDFFEKNDGTWHSHVEFGNWADVFVIAPVSATTMGKMVNGIADNLLVATYLAAKCPVYIAPAMDVDMFLHPSTQKNIERLKSFGNILIEPETGELASGLSGPGRLQEPETITEIIKSHFQKKKDFKGKRVLISAGPTYELIDPVRFIGNFSSGRMGYAIAEAMAERGAEVELISGPVELIPVNTSINLTRVTSAGEMFEACKNKLEWADVIIMAAAVADYTPTTASKIKIKKKEDSLSVKLKPTVDILKYLGENKSTQQVLVGFALETDNELENAKNKLKNKNLDLIVLNSLKDEGAGFGHSTNKVTFIDKYGAVNEMELKQKYEVASDLADKLKNIL